jgi:hypothetical protein
MAHYEHYHDETPWRDEDLLRKAYEGRKMSCREIADMWETTPRTISRWLNRHGIETRGHTNEEVGSSSSNLYAYVTTPSEGQRVLVHRLVAVAEYGFEAVAEADIVHHKDGNPWVNSRDNVAPMSSQDHTQHHNGV